jgi:hypothetical protein
MAWKEIRALSLLSIIILLALPTVSASGNSLSDLKSSISGFDDPRMDIEDLAFYLASHGFDATPKAGYVEVDLNGGHLQAYSQRRCPWALQYSCLM